MQESAARLPYVPIKDVCSLCLLLSKTLKNETVRGLKVTGVHKVAIANCTMSYCLEALILPLDNFLVFKYVTIR